MLGITVDEISSDLNLSQGQNGYLGFIVGKIAGALRGVKRSRRTALVGRRTIHTHQNHNKHYSDKDTVSLVTPVSVGLNIKNDVGQAVKLHRVSFRT